MFHQLVSYFVIFAICIFTIKATSIHEATHTLISSLESMKLEFLNSKTYPWISLNEYGAQLNSSTSHQKFIMFLFFSNYAYRKDNANFHWPNDSEEMYEASLELKMDTLKLYAHDLNLALLQYMSIYMQLTTTKEGAMESLQEVGTNNCKLCTFASLVYPQFLKWENELLKNEHQWKERYQLTKNQVMLALYHLSALSGSMLYDPICVDVLTALPFIPTNTLQTGFRPFYDRLKLSYFSTKSPQEVRTNFSNVFGKSIDSFTQSLKLKSTTSQLKKRDIEKEEEKRRDLISDAITYVFAQIRDLFRLPPASTQ